MDKFPQNVILSGVSMILSTNHEGIIEHETLDSVKIGYFENSNLPLEIQETRCKRLINKHNECVYDDNVKLTRWRKLVYNATLNSVCTLTGVDVGRLELWGANDTITRKAMREVLEIAKSNGVEVPESTIEEMLGQMGFITHHMLVDIRKGNRYEKWCCMSHFDIDIQPSSCGPNAYQRGERSYYCSPLETKVTI